MVTAIASGPNETQKKKKSLGKKYTATYKGKTYEEAEYYPEEQILKLGLQKDTGILKKGQKGDGKLQRTTLAYGPHIQVHVNEIETGKYTGVVVKVFSGIAPYQELLEARTGGTVTFEEKS